MNAGRDVRNDDEKMDEKTDDRAFLEAAKQLNDELSSYLDGQQVTRESLDVVISL